MTNYHRRRFLSEVGSGMLVSSIGAAMALDLGLLPALASDSSPRVTFGELEPLVSLMQESAPDELLPKLVDRLGQKIRLSSKPRRPIESPWYCPCEVNWTSSH